MTGFRYDFNNTGSPRFKLLMREHIKTTAECKNRVNVGYLSVRTRGTVLPNGVKVAVSDQSQKCQKLPKWV